MDKSFGMNSPHLFGGRCQPKPTHQPQRWLNPYIQEVVRNEILKLLEVEIIYSISDSTS